MNKQIINDLEVAHLLSGSLSTWSLVELEFVHVGFWREWKARLPWEKNLSEQRREPTRSLLNPWCPRRDLNVGHYLVGENNLLLLPLITLAPLGLGHKATKGSVEFNTSVFWITLMICSNFILTEGRWAVILSSNCPGCQEPEVETR